MIISRTVEFDAAHRLTFHQGKCRYVHGHRWRVDVQIGVEEYKDMVLDFGDIKRLLTEHFDHKILIYEKDAELLRVASEMTDVFQACVLPCETTAENLASVIRGMIQNIMTTGEPAPVTVTVFETPNSAATV